MITIEHTTVTGWEAALRGMRNPLNSWDKSDSYFNTSSGVPVIGKNDKALALKLCEAGSEHRKFLRYITVTFDLTAPILFWQQIDTYKVGTVRNSTSKMHKLLAKPFELSDFAVEDLPEMAKGVLTVIVDQLNAWRQNYIDTPKTFPAVRKELWESVLRLLPESYCQTSTMLMNYEVLKTIYRQRKGHKLGEWRVFLDWIESLPYSELITGGETLHEVPLP